MPEFVLTLKLDDKDYKVKIIADSEEAEKLRKKFEETGNDTGRTINELRTKLKNLKDVFDRTEIGTPEFRKLKAEIEKTNIALSQAEKGVEEISDKSKSLPEQFAQWGNIVTGINQGLEVARKLYSIISKPIGIAGQFEQLDVQFEVLLGSLDKAKKLIGDIQKLGASTPLELMDLQKNTKTLLAFGVAGEEVVDILRMLGDVSGGDAERLSQLTLAYSQMQSTGRLMGQDLLQMINAGFNPLKVISDETGKSIGQLKKEMEGGAITSDMVTNAFKRATSEGGQFYNMMQKQSQTYEGMKSNLEDAITMMNQAVGEVLLPTAKNFVDIATGIVRGLTPVRTNLDQVTESAMRQRMEFEKLVIQYEELRKKNNKTNEEAEKYNSIIDTLQSKYPEIFSNLDLHKEKIENLRDAFQQTRDEIEKTIRAELRMAEAKDLIAEQMKFEDEKRFWEQKILDMKAQLQLIRQGTLEDKRIVEMGMKPGTSTTVKLSDRLKEDIDAYSKNVDKAISNIDELQSKINEKLGGETLPEESGGGKTIITPGIDPDKINSQIKQELDLHKKQKELNQISLQDYEDYLSKRLETLANNTHAEKMLRLQFIEEMQKVTREKEELTPPKIVVEGGTPEDIDLSEWEKQQVEEQLRIGKLKADAIDDQYAREYELLKLWKQQELLEYEGISEAKTIIDEIYANRKAEIDQKVAEQQIDIASKTIGSLAQLLGKHTAAYKVLAAAQAIIDTYKAANVALASAPPPWNYIAMAGVIATGLQNVISIQKTDTSMKGFVKGGVVVGEDGPEIIAPMQDYATGQAQLVNEAVMAVERRMMALTFSDAGGSYNRELVEEMKRTNKRIDELLQVPIVLDDSAVQKIYERGRKLSGYRT